eukprot:PhM_4_TR11468/c0_g1_i1/m.67371
MSRCQALVANLLGFGDEDEDGCYNGSSSAAPLYDPIEEDDNALEYNGEKLHGVPHGEGELRYVNGDVYKGSFRRGRPHGFGSLKRAPKGGVGRGEVYTGNFCAGLPHGDGTLRRPNGNVYKGPFENGRRHGDGVLITKNSGTFNVWYENGVCMSKHPVTWMVDQYSPDKSRVKSKSRRRRKSSASHETSNGDNSEEGDVMPDGVHERNMAMLHVGRRHTTPCPTTPTPQLGGDDDADDCNPSSFVRQSLPASLPHIISDQQQQQQLHRGGSSTIMGRTTSQQRRSTRVVGFSFPEIHGSPRQNGEDEDVDGGTTSSVPSTTTTPRKLLKKANSTGALTVAPTKAMAELPDMGSVYDSRGDELGSIGASTSGVRSVLMLSRQSRSRVLERRQSSFI